MQVRTAIVACVLLAMSIASWAADEAQRPKRERAYEAPKAATEARHGPRQGGQGEARGQRQARFAEMERELGLTPEQSEQLRALHRERNETRAAKRAEWQALPPAERQAAMRAEREEFRKKLSQILTPEQLAQHDALMRQRRQGAAKQKSAQE